MRSLPAETRSRYFSQWIVFDILERARADLKATGSDAAARALLNIALFSLVGKPLSWRRERDGRFPVPGTTPLSALKWGAWLVRTQDWRSHRFWEASSKKRPVLFGIWAANHIDTLAPVMRHLRDSAGVDARFLAMQPGWRKPLEKTGLPFREIGHPSSRGERAAAMSSYLGRVRGVRPLVSELIAPLGLALGLGKHHVAGRLGDTLTACAALASAQQAIAAEVLDELRPECMVIANQEMIPGRMLVELCAKRSIPVVNVQHGIITPHPKFAWPRSLSWCLWGTASRDVLTALGWNPDDLVVCGHIHNDAASPRPAAAASSDGRVRRALFVPDSLDGVISKHELRAAISIACTGVSRDREIELTILVEPDADETATELAGVYDGARIQTKDCAELRQRMLDSDVVITMWSATAVEALLLERPLIVVEPAPRRHNSHPVAQHGAALVATNAHALSEWITSLADARVRESLRSGGALVRNELAGEPDGKAVQRIAETILGRATDRR